ncbi:efflux RND transporter periplasmic adaptor subunit [Desulfosarcina sp. OttesenSCG-928-A07]|nr:efflux RND transporter periplasmic adaptor subunit [Desulfosarcina sp. OttesenSCG-928-A07]
MKKQWIKKPGILVVMAIVALSAFWAGSIVLDKSTNSDALAAERAAPPAYHYETIQPMKVTLTTELPGRVSAFMVSEVRPQVSGIITERLFTEGSDVTAGQVLYQIDPAIYEAALGNAKAALARAEANEQAARLLADRYNKLVKTNAVSKQERDDAVAAYGQARADIEAARQAVETASINLGYTKITAPVPGRISRSQVTPGALATQHQADPLATIQQLDKVYVDVTHSSSELLKLRLALAKGDLKTGNPGSARAKLRLENGAIYARLPDVSARDQSPQEIEGDLLFSEVTIEQSTGVVAIRALFDNPDKILLPGMYVRAVMEEGTREDGILVPQKAVMRDTRGRSYVYVLTRETPRNAETTSNLANDSFYVAMRHVQIDRHYNNMWLLSAGLEPGDKVLIQGLQKVRPGQLVTGIEGASSSDDDNNEQAR